MELKLTSSQFKTLADFFNDIAKGLVLGAFLGQGVLPTFPLLSRLLVSLFWLIGALFLLYFALLFSKEEKL
ncbi:MAG: hypothetical protein ACPLXP_01585 [Microgenomates group bacterium]